MSEICLEVTFPHPMPRWMRRLLLELTILEMQKKLRYIKSWSFKEDL